ncbi:uncharacterized protein [Musca autumnalis]|uniref:uncharacterized protein n=1 Tax=Musca autumnalis TaxID=221902 RepID=UPI003CE7AD05
MHLIHIWLVFGLFQIWFFTKISCGEVYIKFTKLECEPNPKYFYNHTCRLKAVNRYKTIATMKTLIKDVLRNVSVNIVLYARNDVQVFRPLLVNFTANICEFLDKKQSNIYMGVFMKFLSQYSNVNHSCPYTVLQHCPIQKTKNG